MAQKIREGIVNISLEPERSTFSALLHLFSKEDLFSEVGLVRSILSNEKEKILHTIKEKKPVSIYVLAKELGRDFKAVSHDLKLLEKYGFIELVKQSKGKRKMLKPILAIDNLQINISFK